MDVQEFEQAILRLAFETDARITTASVAYYLGIPSRKANELLNALLEEGVLELDSDTEGNLYYRVPNHPEEAAGLMPQLRREQQSEVDADVGQPGGNAQGGESNEGRQHELSPSVMLVSASDDDDSDPVSPGRPSEADRAGSGSNVAGEFARLAGRRSELPSGDDHDPDRAGRWHNSEPQRAGRSTGGGAADGWNPRTGRQRQATRQRRSDHLFAGLTQRQARPDASLDRCGASSVIVSDAVRCDPKPLPSRKPVVASCADSNSRRTQWAEPQDQSSGQLFERAQTKSTMLAPTAGGELAMRQDGLERPEHQPGMALLLSLILCGTGQIYNGEVSKGIMMMVLCFLLWFVLLGWVVHIWSIVDSVVVAERLNRKAG
ncbi:MAG: hypothetical protein ACOC9J_03650 [Persicimonas sp.]